MAGIKIVNLPALGRNLASTDLFELSLAGGTGSRKITGQEIISAIPSGITIGTTAITSGTVGRVLFEGTGNVVSESANLFWDNTNVALQLGTTSTRIFTFRPQDTTSIYGNSSSIRGGQSGRIDFCSATDLTHISDGRILLSVGASVNGPYLQIGATNIVFAIAAAERARFAATTGNFLINTTTDAGFKLDVNGTARVSGNTTILTNGGRLTLQQSILGTAFNGINFNDFSGAINSSILNNQNTGEFRIYTGASYFPTFYSNNAERMRIDTSGNVGIGTSTPQYKFHVNVADVTYSTIFSSTTGSVRFLPYLSSVYGANISTLNAGQTAQIPLSLSANKFIFENGNVLIGTTTDAGFKLDVNGTARVQGRLQIGTPSTTGEVFANGNTTLSIGGGQITNAITFSQINDGRIPINNAEGSLALMTISQRNIGGGNGFGNVIRMTGAVENTINTNTFNNIQTNTVINTSGGTTIYRGFYHNPTLTATVGVTHYAFHSTSGRVRLEGLPTSPAGLSAGDLYNNSGVLMIV
jgi:hypothetical protein